MNRLFLSLAALGSALMPLMLDSALKGAALLAVAALFALALCKASAATRHLVWRVHVEHEHACNDLVLASGERPSADTEHLLQVATRLSPGPCGLAMARESSQDGRLTAILSETRNRRRVSGKVAVVALILGAGLANPLSMVRAAGETTSLQCQ